MGESGVMQVRKRAVRKIFGGGGSRTCTNSTVKLKSSREKGVRIFSDHDDRSSGDKSAVSGALLRTDASVDGFECPMTWREVAISMENTVVASISMESNKRINLPNVVITPLSRKRVRTLSTLVE